MMREHQEQSNRSQLSQFVPSLIPGSLEGQLMGLAIIGLTLSLLAYGAYTAAQQAAAARTAVFNGMAVIAVNLANISSHFVLTEDLDGLEIITRETTIVPGLRSITLVNLEGQPLVELVSQQGHWSAQFDNSHIAVPAFDAPFIEPQTQGDMFNLWRPVAAGKALGWIRISFQTKNLKQVVIAIWTKSIVFISLAITCSLLLLKGLLHLPMRSLREATHFADALHQCLGNELRVDSQTSEIQLLSQALNNVSIRLYLQNKELTQARDAAHSASLAKSQFLANMSHELRTPMNAILGMLTLLRKTELTSRQADYASKSIGAARSLLEVLNEILDFSKIEAGKMTLDPRPFQVSTLLRSLSLMISSSLANKPVEVLFDIDPLVPSHLIGDDMRLQQVLLNLASNAIKFTAQGEVVLAIRVEHQSDTEARLEFSLRDSGIGIAAENQTRIFEGFSQAESSTTRRFGGTGLGLVISQRFVELMGGEIKLHSELGQGSRFFFTIELLLAQPVGAPEPGRAQTPMDGRPWRILVIDDNASARAALDQMGQSLGWTVDLASGGAQALKLLDQKAREGIGYQAILVDWTMPEMDGWQTSQRIRQQQAELREMGDNRPASVVVMVTAHGREELNARSSGEQKLLDGFLVKPLTAAMLLDAIVDAQAGQGNIRHKPRPVADSAYRRLYGMRLLLVEDNATNQQVARELLEEEGAQVQITNDGEQAVAAVAKVGTTFDAVLMDIQMPVMDGYEATRRIRTDLNQTDLPIIAMTANAMPADRDASLANGMNAHIAKPFDISNLVQVLRDQTHWQKRLVAPELEQDPRLGTGSKPVTLPNPELALPLVLTLEQAATLAGVDLPAALKRLGGMQDLYRRMLASFIAELQNLPAQLKALRQHSDPAKKKSDVTRLFHTLKGLALTMGATELSVVAANAEQRMSTEPSPAQLTAACQQLETEVTRCLPALQGLLALME
ncbi:response regulator [Reinekea sp.]|jgi:signal transduction histidine kinase/CheY-like chemotaxis protein|uniref:hybrid sensor histidine kinase/response regulator n=1 Tax=Reinekea sp. TaxID=1970455 RepID=UPI002A8400ED|nr:response regulator [Reinekea sp.]